jgi:hypothetical protein
MQKNKGCDKAESIEKLLKCEIRNMAATVNDD